MGKTHHAAWAGRSGELADWALARLFVRSDRFGGYYLKGGKTQKSARPNAGCTEPLSRDVLARHFRATRTGDVIGSYSLTAGEDGVGRWAAIDIDAHGPADDPQRNERYALHLYKKAADLEFRPLLATWGLGGFHLWVLLDRDVPGPVLLGFGRWLASDAGDFGYQRPPESFPKQATVPEGKFGNWLRLPGRQHTRDEFATVYDGAAWVAGAAAVDHLLTLSGDSPDLIPAGARPAAKSAGGTGNGKAAGSKKQPPFPGRASGPDVFEAYNRTVGLDTVVGWHEARGHRVTRRDAGRVEFVRAGKDGGGQSLNVQVIGSVPVTYNFSANAGLPDQRGLSPAQVRCHYETGACDAAAMSRFAAALRQELGWPAGVCAPAGDRGTPPTGDAPRPDPLAGEKFKDTDLANAARFVSDHGGVALYVADWRRWAVYDGVRWVVDATGAVAAGLAHQTLRRMASEAAEKVGAAARLAATAACEDEEAAAGRAMASATRELAWAKKSQDVKRVTALLEMARTYLLVPAGAELFDTAPHLLNCPNGTVDLRTGELHPHSREDHLTKLCPTQYDPDAAAPTYLRLLGDVLPSDVVARYARGLSGYAVTGEVTDQTLHLFHGPGGNGKGVLLDLWVDVLGDGEYATTAPSELIADGGENRHPTEKTVLRGVRLAVCQETDDEERLNGKRVKNLTGGSRIIARGMRQDFYSFPPTHKLVLATNHLPWVRVNDHATWRRLRVVPFPNVFWTDADRKSNPSGDYPEARRADAGLPIRLRAEAAGVLADMVAHAIAFYRNGGRLNPPDQLVEAGVKYRKGEDAIGRFFDEFASRDPNGRGMRGGEFYRVFQQWYRAEIDPEGVDTPRSLAFYTTAAERFGEPRKVGGYMTYAVRLSQTNCNDAEPGDGECGEGGSRFPG